ncbi:SH2 domain-containing protein 5 [Takifugu flavidus]|uniref:SH2 domain-containing protein 5 n=1 Tax=Takifugu flavidus TaxID=433684 RepID=A0A5C6N6R6_9TELE|nr:SH2 domain-containing protein 5 [Takifugu flavidus]
MGEAPGREDGTVTRSAEYVGSFPVDDLCLDDQIVQLHTQLKALKSCRRRRPVSVRFSIKGVKIYDEDETTLLMAHALRRVSLSTARPVDAQFAFVSHNPGSVDAQLYCHVFRARHARAAQFLNLLLCRCFQLSYLEKHPEEDYRGSEFFTVASFICQKKSLKSYDDPHNGQDEVFASSPSLVRKKAMRAKVLRSGAYRSFTFTPLKQRNVQERLNASQGNDPDRTPPPRSRAPSLAETEEALVQAVWCWAGIAIDSSYSLLADDVLGSFLLCPHPKKTNYGSLVVRGPSGLVTRLVENTRKGKFLLEKCKSEFGSIAELIEHYTKAAGDLPCTLSCARVNHCYEWEENASEQPQHSAKQRVQTKPKTKLTHGKKWV